MVRLHKSLYQVNEEIKAKAAAVPMDSREFLGIDNEIE